LKSGQHHSFSFAGEKKNSKRETLELSPL